MSESNTMPTSPRYVLTTNEHDVTRCIRMEAQLAVALTMAHVNGYTYTYARHVLDLANAYIQAGINPRESYVLTELIYHGPTTALVDQTLSDLESYMVDPYGE